MLRDNLENTQKQSAATHEATDFYEEVVEAEGCIPSADREASENLATPLTEFTEFSASFLDTLDDDIFLEGLVECPLADSTGLIVPLSLTNDAPEPIRMPHDTQTSIPADNVRYLTAGEIQKHRIVHENGDIPLEREKIQRIHHKYFTAAGERLYTQNGILWNTNHSRIQKQKRLVFFESGKPLPENLHKKAEEIIQNGERHFLDEGKFGTYAAYLKLQRRKKMSQDKPPTSKPKSKRKPRLKFFDSHLTHTPDLERPAKKIAKSDNTQRL